MEFPNDKLQQYISQIEELVARINWLMTNHGAMPNLLITQLYATKYLDELKERLMKVIMGENE